MAVKVYGQKFNMNGDRSVSTIENTDCGVKSFEISGLVILH